MNFAKDLFSNIGKYRSALMGFSMIAVFMFHAHSAKLGFQPTGFVGAFCSYGYLGVDIFLFLSAYGLCFSLKRNDLKHFFCNRFIRIMPTWWVILFLVHIAGLVVGSKIPTNNFVYPHTFVDMFYWYTGLGFIFNTCHYEWYIPTLLIFYLLIPLIYRLSRIHIMLIIALFIPAIVLYTESEILQHLSLLINRIPVFILGALFFKESEHNNYNRFLIFCFSIFIYTCIFNFFFNVPIPLRLSSSFPILIGLLSYILSLKYISFIEVFLSFVGSCSLELYLIHLYRRPQFLLSLFIKNAEMQVLGAFILCLTLSYLLHEFVKIINEKYLSRIAFHT